ncbi:hypothetical protein BN59_00390 [Legionella massiliensis]|uniref:Putative integrase N-terminal domain-containing protein n=1 Tax=Legionella massiliensis TaxID=1034943 RepID=A0A078KWJ7_9GAMM|nr:phage integrase N-terminal domain-containing protein [Legionella massiliensis]CDZ76124.1 hypothetical protein BN59_00390 [Legionella massiliensis]CEE11862.1 hypothetical protein BN1094_00390 [Legionella massiliensis]
MTANSLRKQATLLMKTNKDGSYKERQRRAFVLNKMLDGLYTIKQTPASWQELNTQQIHSLVSSWKAQRVKPATIMRYMTIIRKVLADLGCHVRYIDNKSLLLSRSKPRKKRIKISADSWQSLTNPAVRLIMALQTHFGLTFQEAIHFKTSTQLQNNQLMISDRTIPVLTKEQRAILNEFNLLVDEDKSLIKNMASNI